MNLRIHEAALRQYTEYDAMGSPRSPMFSSPLWTSGTFGGDHHHHSEPLADIQTSLDRFEEAMISSLPILDVYATKAFTEILKDPAAVLRLRQFAEGRGRAKDIDCLLQMSEFVETVISVGSIVTNISHKYLGVAASEPVRLPLVVGRGVNTDIRDCTNTILPSLEGLFDEARISLEHSLAQDLYPDFLRHQLSLSLQSIGPGYSPNQTCPGFGEAFCMTDPNADGNPIVYASEGLAGLTGFTTKDMIFQNCGIFQGAGTRGSCVERMRNALAKRDEFLELMLSYTKDGRMYWSLVFMARMAALDGVVQYHLGGQIDVTGLLERQEDVNYLLSYASPLSDLPPVLHKKPDERERRGSWRTSSGGSRDKRGAGQEHSRGEGGAQPTSSTTPSKYPPSASRSKLLQTLRRRRPSQTSHDASGDSNTDASLSDPSTPLDVSWKPLESPGSFPKAAASSHHMAVSPYSRFMVLEYVEPSSSNHTILHHSKRSSPRVQLPVAFCSAAALASFGAINAADVLGRSVFEVLGESSSVTKSFKSNVRASLAEGRTVKQDIGFVVGGGCRKRSRGVSLSRKRSGIGLAGLAMTGGEYSSPGQQGRSLRRSLSLERLVPTGSNSSSGGGGYENFVSYWTPMKDDLGVVQWVVLILVPEVG